MFNLCGLTKLILLSPLKKWPDYYGFLILFFVVTDNAIVPACGFAFAL
jgi:hypothetical protein